MRSSSADHALERVPLLLRLPDQQDVSFVAKRPWRPSCFDALAIAAVPSYDGVITRTGRRARWIRATGTLPSTLRATRPLLEAPQTITSASFSSA